MRARCYQWRAPPGRVAEKERPFRPASERTLQDRRCPFRLMRERPLQDRRCPFRLTPPVPSRPSVRAQARRGRPAGTGSRLSRDRRGKVHGRVQNPEQ